MEESSFIQAATESTAETYNVPLSASDEERSVDGVFHRELDDRVRPYIDLIDSLRMIGVEKDLALPAIAVIGDQSSGKSSVLEALSGVALPRGSGIVTRCPLELKLKKIKKGRKWTATIYYREKKENFTNPMLVEKHVRQAQDELAGEGVGISDELISLEIMSPDVCDLTLIDLPGIARVPVGDQPEDIADQIKNLILKFIQKTETINLVVVPCNVDIATTEALKMAKSVDPHGIRTLAILTKPDLIDKGAEMDILKIVKGNVIPLRKGYIIVKCRGQSDINQNIPLEEATLVELNFFQQHTYFRDLLNEQKATTRCLATKLTKDLVGHIKNSLPQLAEQIQSQLLTIKTELRQYDEGPPGDPKLIGSYLTKILMTFNDRINELCARGDSKQNLYPRLRPMFREWFEYLDNTKEAFQLKMKEVTDQYDENLRGRELPTFSDYSVFERVVREHVTELRQPATDVLKVIQEIVQGEFNSVAETCFRQYPFLKQIALSKIDDIHSKLEAKVEKRIREYIDMEKLVYIQDLTFIKELSKNSERFRDVTEENCFVYDVRELTPEKMMAYYEVVFQRLADHIPMLTLHFILKESASQLCMQMMDMRAGCNVSEMLREDSEASCRRNELQQRYRRLRLAQEKLLNF
ncbi:interferon-induced GTP-binding protein Mx-like isoform X2 [Scleropages formosus]|uniref:Myxovirus (influenza virus) resistance F n=1 Tax=Scleropages formosus TaxID=113540 RepID=A0A8C9RLP9_SCLFO|nr:interferon-induced GTP-binding protein Mx-like isoform X2 [Scleropages formosus]